MPTGSRSKPSGVAASHRRPRATPSLSTSDSPLDSEHRPFETPIARAIRRQQGPPCREVTVELPFNDSGFLETTIIYPNSDHEPSNPLVRSTNAIVIMLHPWSRAGGRAHDPVLLGFLTTFLRRDYHVILYNSRGVGNSGGSSSWTGFPEAQDLQVVVDLALREVEAVDEIVLLGYSYGSLAASFHPARPPSLFTPANLARNPHVSPNLRIRHILLSYPLGFLWLLSLFHTKTYEDKLRDLVTSPGADVLVLYGERDQFTKKDKYRAWAEGLKSTFKSATLTSSAGPTTPSSRPGSFIRASPTTSVMTASMSNPPARERERPTSIPAPRLQIEVISEADHFWRTTRSTIRAARSIVEDWLDQPLRPSSWSTSSGSLKGTAPPSIGGNGKAGRTSTSLLISNGAAPSSATTSVIIAPTLPTSGPI